MADYPLDIPGFESEPLWLKGPLLGFIGRPKLMQGTERAPGAGAPLEHTVLTNDGEEKTATITLRSAGLDLPMVSIDDSLYEPTPTIPGPELVFGLAPILLALIAGIPGAVMGVAAVMMNLPILRSGKPMVQRIGLVLAVLVLAVLGTQVLQEIVSGN